MLVTRRRQDEGPRRRGLHPQPSRKPSLCGRRRLSQPLRCCADGIPTWVEMQAELAVFEDRGKKTYGHAEHGLLALVNITLGHCDESCETRELQ